MSIGSDPMAYTQAVVSGGSAATALSVANEIVQMIAGLVAIAAGIASLIHFLKQRKRK